MAYLERVLELHFPMRAHDETKIEMKAAGWRWDRGRNAWVCPISAAAEQFAVGVIERDNQREAAFRERIERESRERRAASNA